MTGEPMAVLPTMAIDHSAVTRPRYSALAANRVRQLRLSILLRRVGCGPGD